MHIFRGTRAERLLVDWSSRGLEWTTPIPRQLGNGDGAVSPPHREFALRETHVNQQDMSQAHRLIPIRARFCGEDGGLYRKNGFLLNHPFPFGFLLSMNATMRAAYRNDCLSASSARPSWRRRAASSRRPRNESEKSSIASLMALVSSSLVITLPPVMTLPTSPSIASSR